jgi:subtilisin family serine protease
MQRGLIACLIAICLTTLVQAKLMDDKTTYAMNRFIVKVWKDAGSLDPTVVSGIAQTWDQELSSLNQKWEVVAVERLFRGPSDDKLGEKFELPTFWRFWFAKNMSRDDMEAMLADFSKAKLVQSAEPVGIYPVYDYLPNDPGWTNQYYLLNSTNDRDMDAPQGWTLERGDTVAIFGVTDTGVRFTHSDLAAHIWKNWAEVNGTPGVDDDGNGFVDDSLGWDFVAGISGCASGEDCDTQDNNPSDVAGHGTHVAGIAAAVTNNSNGGCGIAGGGSGRLGARIMPLRIGWKSSDGRGYISMDFAAQGIQYGRLKGVTVFNCSWGSSNATALVAAVDAAVAAGISLTVAAGNDNTSDQSSNYLSTRGDLIDVAATDNTDTRAYFSNYGTWVDVSAPGVSVYSTFNANDNSYAYMSGTSMAAPCVAGEVLLLKSQHPTWTRTRIDTCIKHHTDNIDALNPGYEGLLGSGRINIYLALAANSTSLQITSPNGGETWYTGQSCTITWSSLGVTGKVKLELNRNYPGGAWVVLFDSTTNDGSEPWTVTGPITSTARMRVTSVNTPSISGTSDDNFTLALPWISVTAPSGGESWVTFENRTITWLSAGFLDSVKIELTRNFIPAGSSTWETVIANTSNDGSYGWTLAGSAAAARVRISRASDPTIADSSNSNFTITMPNIVVTSPTDAISWYVGEGRNITWNSALLTGNVKIELARNYNPTGGSTWDLLYNNTVNDGTEPWTVNGMTTTTARVRITSMNYPSVADTSDTDFAIATPYLHVDTPSGGEIWPISTGHAITWSSGGVTGNVVIELNRSYAVGVWDTLFASTANDFSQTWTVTGPVTSLARVRITSVSMPAVTDISAANFSIQGPPPMLTHDPLGDLAVGTGTITAVATSQLSSVASVKMFYRLTGAALFDSLALSPTGNPNEYAHTLISLVAGSYEYFVRAMDIAGLSTTLPVNAPFGLHTFDVGTVCGDLLAYDDGSADKFNWSEGNPGVGTKWAVKIGPVITPYLLCAAQFAASRSLPDTAHTPIHLYVYAADGLGGLPGTLIQDVTTGSVGNVISGLSSGTNWALALLKDDLGHALIVNQMEFYVAVSNESIGKYEAFGRDTTSANAHRSYFYDPCEAQWFSEDALSNSNAHPGNRMLRVWGLPLTAPTVAIYVEADTLRLIWSTTRAPLYNVYAADNISGPWTFYAATSDTMLTAHPVSGTSDRKFYEVTASAP